MFVIICFALFGQVRTGAGGGIINVTATSTAITAITTITAITAAITTITATVKSTASSLFTLHVYGRLSMDAKRQLDGRG